MQKLLPWLAVLVLLIVIFGTVYSTVQQGQRNAANYPQIQLAEDTTTAVNRGGDPLVVVQGHVDIDVSLAPFIVIYDKKGQPLAGSGYLGNKLPKAPIDILKAADGQDYHTVTWEPKDEVRIAAVTVAAKDYYVLSGRSLKEVEKNEAETLQLTLTGAIMAMVLLGVIFVLSGLSDDEYQY